MELPRSNLHYMRTVSVTVGKELSTSVIFQCDLIKFEQSPGSHIIILSIHIFHP